MNRHALRRLLLVMLAICAVAALPWLTSAWLRPHKIVLARLAVELEQATSADEAQRVLLQMSAFGEHGVRPLVTALGSENAVIQREAQGVLSAELDRWQLLPPREATRRLTLLARSMAAQVDGWPNEARHAGADFATRILLWPTPINAEGQQRIADCEHVLRSISPGESNEPASPRMASRSLRTTVFVSPLDKELALPGGNLPLEATAAPRSQPQAPARVRPVAIEPDLTPVVPPAEEPRRFLPEVSASVHEQPIQEPAATDTLALMRQLAAPDARQAANAEDALRRQGFGEVQLAVARRFADPNPAVRLQLVEQLRMQTVVDARPWLLRLLEDVDRHVREASARVLSTSSDPLLERRLRERALVESDPTVRRLLER